MLFNRLQHWLASISADCQNTASNVRNKQIKQSRQPKLIGCLFLVRLRLSNLKCMKALHVKVTVHSGDPPGHELRRAVGRTQVCVCVRVCRILLTSVCPDLKSPIRHI